MRIAMWSGPRNLSTAMMYAFAQRPDCVVWDEPFYAAYLAATGLDHPMREQVIAAGDVSPEAVITRCIGAAPGGKRVFYQKHMAQHMRAPIRRDWLGEVTSVFLIRHPARVIASYAAKRENPSFDDLGFGQQAELVRQVRAMGRTPIVIDSADIRSDPRDALQRLCFALNLEFHSVMLGWPMGPKPYDGVWATHWYGAVHRSTGFAEAEGALPAVDSAFSALYSRAMEVYEALWPLRLT
ncbi:MAG: HAD family hydrolase [Rhodobacter sp.]|nr:HAD family hydrolase [Rhodobacter sp.]